MKFIPKLIFWSRWLQAPLYVGLIVAQGVYVYKFAIELFHLFMNAPTSSETQVMLAVIGLIDVVMVANLLIMVIVGGYETFVSRLRLEGHPDQPEWLDHLNAGTMKIKFALALVGISSIHLLKTFLEAKNMDGTTIMWQVIIHMAFVISALLMAYTNNIMSDKKH
jgi:uncharacterized protein (TIGR00645 family)